MAELIKAVWNFDICLCPQCECPSMKQLGSAMSLRPDILYCHTFFEASRWKVCEACPKVGIPEKSTRILSCNLP